MTRASVVASVVLAAMSCSSGRGLVLHDLVDARSTAATIRIDFRGAVERSSHAVMADTDEDSVAAAHDARDARERVEGGAAKLEGTLKALGYDKDVKLLGDFKARYAEYTTLDDSILDLAVENSNLKAQRLAFGPGREAVAAMRMALKRAVSYAPLEMHERADGLVSATVAALLEVEVIESQHIAEPDDLRMTEMESRIMRQIAEAGRALDRLQAVLPKNAMADIASADVAFETFKKTDAELIQLSRRNTNVRSLALTLGRKRTLAAACEDSLTALTSALEAHQLAGSR